MENYIKEAKNSFNFDRICSHSFQVNEVRMMLKPAGVQPNELASYTLLSRGAKEYANPNNTDKAH
ncbi:hypothetical protein GCM10011391_16140 [Pullulanibacillus camelliae]|uniref:Uncharacterized protein n=1 Tax=Pullulanibacillus camelliae TaxID=1707096 RepID=A0A8J2VRM8_9BACL|nr:hypothetical protein GCM10011391_16140 [Pullulanibacillus camelliae]